MKGSEQTEPLNFGSVARAPWKRFVDIAIPATSNAGPTKANSNQSPVMPERNSDILYTSVIMYNYIAKNMTWKRLTGNVKQWQVVDYPYV